MDFRTDKHVQKPAPYVAKLTPRWWLSLKAREAAERAAGLAESQHLEREREAQVAEVEELARAMEVVAANEAANASVSSSSSDSTSSQ